jgi:hypothetical protein
LLLNALNQLFKNQTEQILVTFSYSNSKKRVGEYFIDRNGKAFEAILDWYRTGQLLIPPSCTPEMVRVSFSSILHLNFHVIDVL